MDTEFQRQAQIALARGWLNSGELEQAWSQARLEGLDLASLLQRAGRLDPSQSQELRAAWVQPAAMANSSASYEFGSGEFVPPGGFSSSESGPVQVAAYDVISEISRGGMGVVYRARHRVLGHQAAVKLMLNSGPSETERFLREARALAELRHPNIVGVMDCGEADGRPYMAMEFINGQSLKSFIQDRRKRGDRIGPEEASEILAPIARALLAIHERGLIHRDLKPDNILLERAPGGKLGRSVLVDFGLVKRTGGSETSLTASGVSVGTLHYMAPEQLDEKDFGEQSAKTDIWAMGGILLAMLSGEAPFSDGSTFAMCKRLLTVGPPKLRDRLPEAPDWLESLVDRCLSMDPAARPTTQELLRALEEQDWSADGESAEPEMARAQSKTGLLIALTLLSLLALVAVLFLALKPDPPPKVERLGSGELTTEEKSLTLLAKTLPNQELRLEEENDGRWVLRETIRSDGSGRAEFDVALQPGALHLRLVSSPEAPAAEWTIQQSVEPPIIELEGDSPIAGTLCLNSDRARLSGRVLDASRVQFSIQGKAVSLTGGKFSFAIPESAWLEGLELRAEDAHGLVTEKSLRLLRGQANDPLLILQFMDLWQKANSQDQDAAFAEVALRFSGVFDRMDAQVFECGGQRFRIGRFRHKKSTAVFHLIPGGVFKPGLREGEQKAEAAEVSRYLESLPASAQALDMYRPRAIRPAQFDAEVSDVAVRLKPYMVSARELSFSEFARGGMSPPFENRGDWPAVGCTVHDMERWCQYNGLRLPSEVEWEFAARAGTTTRFFWGERYEDRYAWSVLDIPRSELRQPLFPMKVGGHSQPGLQNAFGLEDILGNAWELCADDWSPKFQPQPEGRPYRNDPPNTNPFRQRPRRGGGFLFGGAPHNRVTERGSDASSQAQPYRSSTAGFRPVVSIP